MFQFTATPAYTNKEILAAVQAILGNEYKHLLPQEKGAKILIKPNFNSNMNALTGNTSDLRILAAISRSLKDLGYSDITLGEGTNSGFYRSGINVISRLRIDQLTRYYGVKFLDLNQSKPHTVQFEDGITADLASECVEADLFINAPKLKTHFEVGMSVCQKNLIGCMIGQANKKLVHKSLAANIININKAAPPHLHIIDGVISMEGLGPSRGHPVGTNMIFAGTDSFLIDMLMAKFVGFDPKKITTLVDGVRQGLITDEHIQYVENYHFEKTFNHDPPKAGFLATYIHSPKRQKYFLAVRNTPFFTWLASTKWFGHLLYLTGLRQDNFIDEDMVFEGLGYHTDKCQECGNCEAFCPVDLTLPLDLTNTTKMGEHCVQCLYCYSVCPHDAIEFKGNMGFFGDQQKLYGEAIRQMHRKE
ncbi:MAG: DUF362 domain-containing protein [Magnetococcales bacterium]|nr:DUF362 domain-containing protein [Magnetococcales bacterium]